MKSDKYRWQHAPDEPFCACPIPGIYVGWPFECSNCMRRLPEDSTISSGVHDLGTLTEESLRAMMRTLPDPPRWRGCVVRPATEEALRRHCGAQVEPLAELANLIGGLPLWVKSLQLADAWMFQNLDDLYRYMRNEITEIDLIDMAASGKSKSIQCLTQL